MLVDEVSRRRSVFIDRLAGSLNAPILGGESIDLQSHQAYCDVTFEASEELPKPSSFAHGLHFPTITNRVIDTSRMVKLGAGSEKDEHNPVGKITSLQSCGRLVMCPVSPACNF